ncbi:MAG: TIGR02452 family protein [Isosphaeraceae bacterium]
MTITRERLAGLARETLAILEAGEYRNAAGDPVSIRPLLDRAIAGTESFPPNRELPAVAPGNRPTRITVDNLTTLAAAQELIAEGFRPVALNFASAKNPGGGFLTGARAQEESLARSSGLYPCIATSPMYEYHRAQRDLMYSHYAIYSPAVPVIRSDGGRMLDRPFCCAFITCPAVNAGVVLQREPARQPEIRTTMAGRVARVLSIAAFKGHEAVVLGAWGCGVFGNDPREIAELFRDALSGPFRGAFARVSFAIIERSAGGTTRPTFERVFDGLVASGVTGGPPGSSG